MTEEFRRYLEGESLYGDDFSLHEIEAWYADESEGYADLGSKDASAYRYTYHALNMFHGFRRVRKGRFGKVLAFGGAYGDEILPIADRIEALTIVDPSDAFLREQVHGIPARYVKPVPNGTLPLESQSFDLVTCLGVLHHIPNVSKVVAEIARVLAPDGHLVLREPIISLGDWSKPRTGLTKRERGIPIDILKSMVLHAGLVIERVSLCAFPITSRIFSLLRPDVYNSRAAVTIDSYLSKMFAWNLRYHARRAVEKIRPTSAFVIARKPLK
jgi:SAM-dependent methyltransferase